MLHSPSLYCLPDTMVILHHFCQASCSRVLNVMKSYWVKYTWPSPCMAQSMKQERKWLGKETEWCSHKGPFLCLIIKVVLSDNVPCDNLHKTQIFSHSTYIGMFVHIPSPRTSWHSFSNHLDSISQTILLNISYSLWITTSISEKLSYRIHIQFPSTALTF